MGAGNRPGDGASATGESATGSRATRRSVLASAATGVTAALAGCPSNGGADGEQSSNTTFGGTITGEDFSGERLRVLVWEGPYAERFRDVVKPRFEQRTGATLDLETGWADVLNRIRDAPDRNPPYDVTVTDGFYYNLGRIDGLFEPLRPENVPNLDGVIDRYTSVRTTEYGVPVDGTPLTLLYRADDDIEPSSWGALFEDSIASGIDFGFQVMPVHAMAVGMDEKPLAGEIYDESTREAVVNRIENTNLKGFATTTDDLWSLFRDGKIDVAQWYYEQAEYELGGRTVTPGSPTDITHTTPEENAGVLNHWCVVKNTNKRDLAERFLNVLLNPQVQTAWAQESATMFTAEETTYPESRRDDLPGTDDEASKIAFPDYDRYFDVSQQFNEALDDKRDAA
jgi:spermidine/putrescine transport system substrate-binding protein